MTYYYYDDDYRALGFYSEYEFKVQYLRGRVQCNPDCSKKTFNEMCESLDKDNTNKLATYVWNTMLVVGYIPILSLLPGIFTIVLASRKPKTRTLFSEKSLRIIMLRGVLNLVGLGSLFLPIDLYTTYKRRQNPITIEFLPPTNQLK